MEYSNYWNVEMFKHFPYFLLGTFIFSIMAYFIGSLNGGQILSLIGKKNLGEVGTKNFGATNAGRAYGKIGFASVFLFDMLKAVFAALIFNSILKSSTTDVFKYANIPLALLFVIIGHSWPLYFNFKGGKGVATSFGSIIVINWLFALIAIAIFGIIVYTTRRVAIGSIISTLVGTVLIVFFQGLFPMNLIFNWSHNWTTMLTTVVVCLLVIIRHRENIQRMYSGKDKLIDDKRKDKENEK